MSGVLFLLGLCAVSNVVDANKAVRLCHQWNQLLSFPLNIVRKWCNVFAEAKTDSLGSMYEIEVHQVHL